MQRTVLLIAAAGSLVGSSVQAQSTFHRSIGYGTSEILYESVRCSNGGFVSVGRIAASTTAPADILVLRTDACGENVWVRIIGSTNQANDVGYCVRQTADQGYIVAAETTSVSARLGIALLKLDKEGNLVWSRVLPGTPFLDSPAGAAVRELPDRSLVVIGRIQAAAGGPIHAVLHHMTPAGVPIAQWRYHLSVSDAGSLSFADITIDNGPIAICGWATLTQGAPQRAFLMGVDPAFSPFWAWTYEDPNIPTTADALLSAPGFFGFGGRYATAAGGPLNALICQTGPGGNLFWSRLVVNYNVGFQSAHDDDLDLVFYGSLTNSNESGLLKFNAGGALLLGMRYGVAAGGPVTSGHDVVALPRDPAGESGYLLAGNTNMIAGNGLEDGHLLRTRDNARSGCRENPFSPGITLPPIQAIQRQVVRLPEQGVQDFPVFVLRPPPGNIAYCDNCCTADFNGVDGLTVQDLYDFLADWNSQVGGGPIIIGSADFNGDGMVTVQDLYDYLAAWNAGCP